MNQQSCLRALLIAAGSLLIVHCAHAQSDREVKTKQSELKKEYSEVQEKNQIIRAAAQDKPRSSTGRRRTGATTGYDYTQVKGYQLRSYEDRIDKLFARAQALALFDEEYRMNGTFPVAGRKGLGSSQTRRMEVYYVEASPEEQETYDIDPFNIIEVRIEKLETLPPAETGTEGGEETSLMFLGTAGGEQVAKGFSLSGEDLRLLVKLEDESLWEDILSRRSQEPSIALPSDLFLPEKRGPFIIMTDKELETSASRFSDFWHQRDTLTTALRPTTSEAAGPLTNMQVPVFYPEETKIRIKNPNKEALKISDATFVGDYASQFIIKSPKLPFVLDPKGGNTDKVDIVFDYIGQSPYETRTQLVLEAREARMSQGIDIVANPGKFPADFAILDASLYRLELRSPSQSSFAPDWRLTYTMGNDEIGLPRWATGISTLSIGYKHDMSVGIVLPMNFYAPDLPNPLAFKKTLMSSPRGYNLAFDFMFGFPFALGGNLTVLNNFDGEDPYQHMRVLGPGTVVDEKDYHNDFFHFSTIAQLYYPIMFKDRAEDPTVAFRLHIGGAFARVQRAHIVLPGERVKSGKHFEEADEGKMFSLEFEKDLVDIYFRIAFINLAAKNNYGLGLQYFSGRMMTDAWLELTDWLRVEMKYSFLLRSRELWESETNYFLVTPRVRLGLPSLFN